MWSENGIKLRIVSLPGGWGGYGIFFKMNLPWVPSTLFGLQTSLASLLRFTDQKGSWVPSVNSF